MKNFSLLLPTRNHSTLVKRLFNSIVETTSNPHLLEIVLYADEDDFESHKISHPLLSIVKLIGPNDTMGNIIRKCYEKSQGSYAMLINDDMIFCTKGWDVKVLEEFLHFPDGIAMVYGNDLYYGKRMSTFPILSRTTCELMDKICPVEYRRHCIDSHILDIFNRLSCLGHKRAVYLHNIIFEHMHYELGISITEDEPIPKNDKDDQSLYFSFAEERQRIAIKMAQHIELCKKVF